MAKQVNLLDPLGIAKAVRGQVNTMALQANLPVLPDMPAINVGMDGLPLLNVFNKIPDRPGFGREDRAG